ncbi:glycosylase [Fulvivirga sp. M361]|uniref:alpha-amylase family glycosyl hydrolase n=1 Tax=Fulvivirga sp. M361 TaxID=2594266 RepID=UPI00117B1BC8|nr:alpha-amylase family glycosyl hydrolase [Fulvivirga sp. M361]TRX60160.1 glycosylase [Fulvivirga sp. M361]
MNRTLIYTVFLSCILNQLEGFAQGRIKPETPEWITSAVFYQIYPQTFKDSDGDGIGDLQGIISKLDYVKSLGINALWLNPFYLSPFCDAGYDVADFYQVDPRYGNNALAKKLFEEAHKRDIKVILDFVIGHTSVEHTWFKGSIGEDPKYKNWFIWTDNTWKTPKEYASKFIRGYSSRDGAYMTNFFWCQPKLNYGFEKDEIKYDWQLPIDHPDVLALKEEMKNVLKYWLAQGVDGFRVDMAYSAGKDFWLDVRRMFDEDYPEALLISEWGDPALAIEAGFHADFMHWFKGYDDLFHKKWFTYDEDTYSFFEPAGKGDITVFLDVFYDQYQQLKDNGYISIPVDNHDMIRVKSYDRDDRDLEIIYAFQMTFPSIPFIYYGDEIGMRQLPLEDAPAVEGSYGGRSGNRTPMQWDASKNYGFSTADKDKLYLPQDGAKDAPTVARQLSDDQGLLAKTKKLVELRKTEKALQAYAAFDIVYAKKKAYPFIFSRTDEDEKILVVLNPSEKPVNVPVGVKTTGDFRLLMGDGVKLKRSKGYTQVACDGRSYGIFRY